MPSAPVSPLFQHRHSFRKLRSFHLSPNSQQLNTRKSNSLPKSLFQGLASHAIPLRGAAIMAIAIVASLVFISTVCIAFIGGGIEEPYIMAVLDEAAKSTPGIVLVGENVDVDVDEPSVTVRWSILACGEGHVLLGSAGVHGSSTCGLPSQALHVFVDSAQNRIATYDPSQIPFVSDTGSRRNVQNLVQFDSDHVLDVHQARLYPFDTYHLSSTVRAVSFSNETIPIRKIATIDSTSSFDIQTVDMQSYATVEGDAQQSHRDFDMRITRPGGPRLFSLLIFCINWMLAHVTVGLVIISRRFSQLKSIVKYLVLAGAILLAIPQLRNSMPDAPGFDGVLIDCIGFFPQMIISGFSGIIILAHLIGQEIDLMRDPQLPRPNQTQERRSPPPPNRAPPTPTASSNEEEVRKYQLQRLKRHFQGEYVFPPIEIYYPTYPNGNPEHRKSKTTLKGLRTGAWHYSDGVQ